jgi:hypothetical protein
MSAPPKGPTKRSELPITSPLDLTTKTRPANTPNFPDKPRNEPAAPHASGQPGLGWKIATGVLALTTVGALAWGLMSTSGVQSEVNTLGKIVATQELAAERQEAATEAASNFARSQTDTLSDQVADLATELEVLEEQVGFAPYPASDEAATIAKQLKQTQKATAALEKEKANSTRDPAALATAYATAQAQLTQTQEAVLTLQAEIISGLQDTSGF